MADIPTHADYNEPIYAKGTSRRIYGELYKVIDSSDVILHILDARDPLGTMCQSVLEYIKKEKGHKQVVLIINKCDLVPNWVTVRFLCPLTSGQFILYYCTGAVHSAPHSSLPNSSIPCFSEPLVRERLPHPTPPSICPASLRQEANISRLHWISQRRQVQRDQYPQKRKSMPRCPSTWGN